MTRWAVQWQSRNLLDGEQRAFIWEWDRPLLFRSRAAARAYIKQNYGYIRTRPDLRREPHGWRIPKAVKVKVTLEEMA